MFDPYYKWLGIPPKEQPPNHYRLLGLALFETNSDVIDAAANRQMAYVQSCATGPHASLSQKLLNELAAARLCLLDPARQAAYDATLKPKQVTSGPKSASHSPVPKPDFVVRRDEEARAKRSYGQGHAPETTPSFTAPRHERPRRSLESPREGRPRLTGIPEERESAFEPLPVRRSTAGPIRRRGREGKLFLVKVGSFLTLAILMLLIAIRFWKSRGDQATEERIVNSSRINSNPAVQPASSPVSPVAERRAEEERKLPPRETLVEATRPPLTERIIPSERAPALQGEQNKSEAAVPRAEPKVAAKEGLDIRRLRVSVSETGKCSVVVDGAEDEVIRQPTQGDLTLAGLSDARVVKGEKDRLTITHLFREAKGISDFVLNMDGTRRRSANGVSLDREDGTLVLTPTSASGTPEGAILHYPRYFILPIAVTLDLDKFPSGSTSIMQFDLHFYDERLEIRLSENPFKKGAIWLNAAWQPRMIHNKRMPKIILFNEGVKPVDPGGKWEHEFQLPLGEMKLFQAADISISYNGPSPARIGCISVNGEIGSYLGISYRVDVLRNRLIVKSVAKGSPGDRSGLRKDDIVESIKKILDGMFIHEEILRRMKVVPARDNYLAGTPSSLVRTGEGLVFMVLRAGRMIEVSVRSE